MVGTRKASSGEDSHLSFEAGAHAWQFGLGHERLKRARATLLSFKPPSHRGASPVAKCVFHGDPVADATVAPAALWSAMLWQSAV
eukprot:6025185-Pyramimonas_sp.AAC.1